MLCKQETAQKGLVGNYFCKVGQCLRIRSFHLAVYHTSRTDDAETCCGLPDPSSERQRTLALTIMTNPMAGIVSYRRCL